MKNFLFSIGLISLLGLSGCAGSDNSPTPSPLPEYTPKIHPQLVWSNRIGKGTDEHYLRLTPTFSGETIFVASYDGTVAAMNTVSGTMLWKVQLPYHITTGLGADQDKLFMGTENGWLIALSQKEGAELWKNYLGTEILAAPAAKEGLVVVKGLDNSLTGIAQKDGRKLWHFSQPASSIVLHAASQPQIGSKAVVAGFADGKLVAVDQKTGALLWTREIMKSSGVTDIERMADIDVTPIIQEGVVYTATYQGRIAALSLKLGKILWEHEVSAYSGLALDNQHVYLSDAEGYVWAFDRTSGVIAWRQPKLHYRDITAPTLLENYVVVGDHEGYLHWLSKKDGQFVAREQVDKKGMIAAPAVYRNQLYVYTRDGYLSAFRLTQ